MYGGDEVSAIVIDLGSHTCKAGYAGEDAPKAVFPSGMIAPLLFDMALPPSLMGVPFMWEMGQTVSFLKVVLKIGLDVWCRKWKDSDQTFILIHAYDFSVVGSIDQMDIDDTANNEKSSSVDSKNNIKDSEKGKGKRKLYVGSQAVGFRRDYMEVLSPIKDGVVVDWDIVDSIWDHALRECLLVDPKEHPMLLAEPSSNAQQQRERTAELMFESTMFQHYFWPRMLGGGSTTVAPVHDGYVLQKAVVSSPVGGEFLTDCLMKSLESKGITIKPRHSFKRKEIRPGEFQIVDLDIPNTSESYRLYSQRVIASDIKDCVCRAPDTTYDGADRFKIPDVLFNPSLAQTIPGMESFAEIAPNVRGLPQMVIESINRCDVDIRRELFSSILLAGGTASMQQLKERLEKDLLEESPQAARVKVLASGNATERRFRF
ncbi:hypothetical protein GH714_030061 [Hevea brasiliensis]|uniref:Actin-related protein 4 n=1 Tax=Hevea brasiliensis TaxID=3981 RepID=A0A6A6NJT4_HEVBR|nr:hypothetical protein GH714_030061 [Hevea brasiliensis]